MYFMVNTKDYLKLYIGIGINYEKKMFATKFNKFKFSEIVTHYCIIDILITSHYEKINSI